MMDEVDLLNIKKKKLKSWQFGKMGPQSDEPFKRKANLTYTFTCCKSQKSIYISLSVSSDVSGSTRVSFINLHEILKKAVCLFGC